MPEMKQSICWKIIAAAALISMSAPAVSQSRVTVTLSGHRFTPAPIYLKAGKAVRITIANPSASAHEFRAPEFFYWAKIREKIPGGVVRLASGESKVITLVPRRGAYKVKCGRFGHALLGMSAMIIVH